MEMKQSHRERAKKCYLVGSRHKMSDVVDAITQAFADLEAEVRAEEKKRCMDIVRDKRSEFADKIRADERSKCIQDMWIEICDTSPNDEYEKESKLVNRFIKAIRQRGEEK